MVARTYHGNSKRILVHVYRTMGTYYTCTVRTYVRRHQSRQSRLRGRPRPAHTDLDEHEEQQATTYTYSCCPYALWGRAVQDGLYIQLMRMRPGVSLHDATPAQ
jgi:hypothetical protein